MLNSNVVVTHSRQLTCSHSISLCLESIQQLYSFWQQTTQYTTYPIKLNSSLSSHQPCSWLRLHITVEQVFLYGFYFRKLMCIRNLNLRKFFTVLKIYSTVNLLNCHLNFALLYSIIVATQFAMCQLWVASSTSKFTFYSTTATQKQWTHFWDLFR